MTNRELKNNPTELNLCMLFIREARKTNEVSGCRYKVESKKLVDKWNRTKNETEKLNLRNKLILLNSKIIFEIFYSYLKVNVTNTIDSADIYQELCYYLTRAVDVALKNEKSREHFNRCIFLYMRSSIKTIIKHYYDQNENNIPLIEDDYIIDTEIEKWERKYRLDLIEYCQKECLTERHAWILYHMTMEDRTYEDIGDQYGLTGSRVQQLYYQAIKRMRKFMLGHGLCPDKITKAYFEDYLKEEGN